MPEEQRKESSVLFSLQELKKLEDGRVAQERAEAQARIDAGVKAKQDAERHVREAEEAKVRAAEDAQKRAEEARLAGDREERIRVEGAERQARIDAEARLREEQMRMEIKAREESKKIWPWVLGVSVVLMTVGGGIFYKISSDASAEQDRLVQKLMDQEKEDGARFAEMAAQMKSQAASLEKQLQATKDDTERQKILAAQRALQEKARNEREAEDRRHERTLEQAKKAGAKGIQDKFKKRDVGDDPLGGLGL